MAAVAVLPMPRGRSRLPSRIALARQVDHERTCPPPLTQCHTSPSTSPAPPNSLDLSPPPSEMSPTRAIEDQLHIAYAHDDIHRAKILLLKLKGIDVDSDDDPRIAAVQDEDFDFCFIPNGGLVVEHVMPKQDPQELKRIEKAKAAERRRQEKLRICEQAWAKRSRKTEEHKAHAQRNRLDEAIQILEDDSPWKLAKDLEEKRRQERWRQSNYHASRSVVSYASLTAQTTSPKQPDRFTYSFTIPSTYTPSPRISPRPARAHASSASLSAIGGSCPPQQPPRPVGVSFEDVLNSMHGPLFPIEDTERTSRPAHNYRGSTSQCDPALVHRRHRDSELLDVLFETAYTKPSFSHEGKSRPAHTTSRLKRRNTDDGNKCAACCPALPKSPLSPSSTTSSFSLASSWLSFRTSGSISSASSSPSLSTAITTPAISPPLHSWIKSPSLSPSVPTSIERPLSHSLMHCCRHHTPVLTSVPLSDTPLCIEDREWQRYSRMSTFPCTEKEPLSHDSSDSSANVLIRRMGKLISIAKSFQSAYISAAVFSTSAGSFDYYDDSRSNSYPSHPYSTSTYSNRWRRRASLNDGYHSNPSDVANFLTVSDSSSFCTSPHDRTPPRYIPLVSPFPPVHPPRTALQYPLPYETFFKPEPTPTTTPFRSSAPWRLRQVSNPVCLRLRALKNILGERGYNWEGLVCEGRMNEGLEKVISVAFDERRISSLQITVAADGYVY